ncbi:MAG TPA: hypothetical protein VGD79_13910 [Thermoanaerobaculia bacterium]|jgi:hypothetical protein
MTLSRDSVLALQRHYLGALSTPARMWLEPQRPARLAFRGSAIRVDDDGCVLDFGTVEFAHGELRTVRVFQPGDAPASIRVDEVSPWLHAEWAEDGTLAVQLVDESEGERTGTVSLWIRDEHGARCESLRVRVAVQPRQPLAEILFNGAPAPLPHNFGSDGGDYTIDVANRTSVPLVVTFADLPEWLELEVDGCSRRGPVLEVFFERAAPFHVALRPHQLGRQTGSLLMKTNDRRTDLQEVELQFTSCVTPVRPQVRALPAPQLAVRAPKALATHIRLENWGRSPARVTCGNHPAALMVAVITDVPAARDGVPGTAVLPIRVHSSQLWPGAHVLTLDLQIAGGDPLQCSVALHVTVAAAAARQRREIRPEMIAALIALLLLTAVLLIAARGLP